ncbi:Transcription elongation factor 1-like protein, partial [Golovinomyces cichoracearum]
GKRKAAAKKPVGPRKNEPLPTVFPCLFCNHEKSVMVKLDKKSGVGHLHCKVCNQQFQCAVNYLSAAVDVYSDWVDACDAVAKVDGELEEPQTRAGARSPADVDASTSRATQSRKLDQSHSQTNRRNNDTRNFSGNAYSRQSTRIDDDDY